jgi:ABC-2 type transport system ATP-binding protein
LDIRRDLLKIKERIGVCPQEASAFKFLTGKENIELIGNLHGMEKETLRERTTALLSQAEFTEAVWRKAKGYSGGMMRHLNLLMALIRDPEIVFLDEPTVGMDARARRRTWEYIGSLKDHVKTVILTTQLIEEAQSLSNRPVTYFVLLCLTTFSNLHAET